MFYCCFVVKFALDSFFVRHSCYSNGKPSSNVILLFFFSFCPLCSVIFAFSRCCVKFLQRKLFYVRSFQWGKNSEIVWEYERRWREEWRWICGCEWECIWMHVLLFFIITNYFVNLTIIWKHYNSQFNIARLCFVSFSFLFSFRFPLLFSSLVFFNPDKQTSIFIICSFTAAQDRTHQ